MSLIVLLGGARSGKSLLAQQLAGEEATLIATARAGDAEMAERIRRHREERPPTWTTVEEPVDLRGALAAVAPDETVVVDCLSLWTANLLEAGWKDAVVEEEAPADAPATFTGRQETVKPVAPGSAPRLCSFSIWQYSRSIPTRWAAQSGAGSRSRS